MFGTPVAKPEGREPPVMASHAAIRDHVVEFFRQRMHRRGFGRPLRDVMKDAYVLADNYIEVCRRSHFSAVDYAKDGGNARLPRVRDDLERHCENVTVGRCKLGDGGAKRFEISACVAMWEHLGNYNILPFSAQNAPAFDAASIEVIDCENGGSVEKVSHMSLEEVSERFRGTSWVQFTLECSTTSIATKVLDSYEKAERHIHPQFRDIDTIDVHFVFYERKVSEHAAAIGQKFRNATLWNTLAHCDGFYVFLPYGTGRFGNHPTAMAKHHMRSREATDAALRPVGDQMDAALESIIELYGHEPRKRKRTITDHFGDSRHKENTIFDAFRNQCVRKILQLAKIYEDTRNEVFCDEFYGKFPNYGEQE